VVHPADIALNELHSNNGWVLKRVGKAKASAPHEIYLPIVWKEILIITTDAM
jgi:hypothetical protein